MNECREGMREEEEAKKELFFSRIEIDFIFE
jgi:hypothetical protein